VGATRGPPGRASKPESQYRNSISDIFPTIVVQGKFEPDRRIGGLLAASGTTLSISRRRGYAKMADGIARQVVDEKSREIDWHPNPPPRRTRLRQADHQALWFAVFSAGR
jgi:hypothetical protein